MKAIVAVWLLKELGWLLARSLLAILACLAIAEMFWYSLAG